MRRRGHSPPPHDLPQHSADGHRCRITKRLAAGRPLWAVWGEKALELLIRVSRHQRDHLRLRDLLLRLQRSGARAVRRRISACASSSSASEWYPTSRSERPLRRAGADRRDVQRHGAGDGHRGAVRAGRGDLHLRVLRAEARRRALKIVIELLAAIPSVVWGFIGLTVMSRLISRSHRRAGRA